MLMPKSTGPGSKQNSITLLQFAFEASHGRHQNRLHTFGNVLRNYGRKTATQKNHVR